MKIKNGVYILLLLVACKDGGQIPEIAKKSGWLFAFNNELANKNVNSTASTSFSYSSDGSKFVVQSTVIDPCGKPEAEVMINNQLVSFKNVNCYSVNLSSEGDSPYYYYVISASRTEGNNIYFVSYAFLGQSPPTKNYSFNEFGLLYSNRESEAVGSYSIFSLTTDSNGAQYYRTTEYYLAYAGSVNLVNLFGKISISSQSYMRERFSLESIELATRLACCR